MTEQHQGNLPPYPGPPLPPGNQVPITSQPYVVYPNQTTVIQRTVIPVVIQNQMGYEPCIYTCRSCNLQLMTRVERVPACRTHLFAGLLCILGCWPCVCVPYCVNACNNADHYCSHCGSYIGSYTG